MELCEEEKRNKTLAFRRVLRYRLETERGSMSDQPKPALHQFADDLAAALKHPNYGEQTFLDVVADTLEPLIDWRAADYSPGWRATAEEPGACEHFETFEPAQEWAEDVLNSLPESVREAITERAHERALQHRGE